MSNIFLFLQKYSFIMSLSTFCTYIWLLFCLFLFIKRIKLDQKVSKKQMISLFLLIVYIMIVFQSTVIGRTTRETMTYKLIPFWSYWKVICGDFSFISEILMNYMMLIPVGFLFVNTLNKKVNIKFGLVLGIFISCMIEILQLTLRRGLFEWDDILHNGIGCMIGCILGNKLLKYIRKVKL